MEIETILMDIDGTMTENLPGSEQIRTNPLGHLISLVSEKREIQESEAEAQIRSCGDVEKRCISEILPLMKIERKEFFNIMQEVMKKKIMITPDTLRFLQKMKDLDLPVCTATTNSEFMTLVKLSVAGIADPDGCTLITRYHPGCEFGDPEGKFSPDYYPAILRNHGYDPERTMMIGDEPERDLYPALASGIRYGVIIDRKQKEPAVFRDNGIFINSLDHLSQIIQEKNV